MQGFGNWVNHGGDLYNRRYAQQETRISPTTASSLRLKWRFYTGGDVSATPAVYDGTVYFPSWNGYIYAVKAVTGALVWKKDLKMLTGHNETISVLLTNSTSLISRTTPTVADNMLIIPTYGPAYVVAVNRATGQLIWKTQLDRHPAAVVTMSGTYHRR